MDPIRVQDALRRLELLVGYPTGFDERELDLCLRDPCHAHRLFRAMGEMDGHEITALHMFASNLAGVQDVISPYRLMYYGMMNFSTSMDDDEDAQTSGYGILYDERYSTWKRLLRFVSALAIVMCVSNTDAARITADAMRAVGADTFRRWNDGLPANIHPDLVTAWHLARSTDPRAVEALELNAYLS